MLEVAQEEMEMRHVDMIKKIPVFIYKTKNKECSKEEGKGPKGGWK